MNKSETDKATVFSEAQANDGIAYEYVPGRVGNKLQPNLQAGRNYFGAPRAYDPATEQYATKDQQLQFTVRDKHERTCEH